MRFTGRAYRAHDPRWSFAPLSGAGSAISGGRFNVKGQATLYLSLDPVTAIIEVTQGFTNRLHPMTLCEYDIDCADIAYLRSAEGCFAAGVERETLASPWLTSQRAGRVAPSQSIAQALVAKGFAGAVVPSFAPGAQAKAGNLVLWLWGAYLPHWVKLFDPEGRLVVE